jgi:hypothetical protein
MDYSDGAHLFMKAAGPDSETVTVFFRELK